MNLLSAEVLGGKGAPMDFPQVYLALKTGTIDCHENPLATTIGGKIYEVQKYIMHDPPHPAVAGPHHEPGVLGPAQPGPAESGADLDRRCRRLSAELALNADSRPQETAWGEGITTVVADIDRAAFVARARELDQRIVPVWGSLYQQILDSQK